MAKQKTNWGVFAVLVGILVIFIVAILTFLNTSDGYAQYEITGREVLNREPASFWWWMVAGAVVGLVLLYGSITNYLEKGPFGYWFKGKVSATIILAILALLCLCGPWGKACTDKTNGGVGLPGITIKQQ